MSLSDPQFAKAVNTQGGASRHMTTGEVPSSGYMISVPGREQVGPSPTSVADVAGFRHREAGLHPDAYQGAWADVHPHTGEPAVFHDVSTRHEVPYGQARDIGEQRKQIGIFNLGNFETAYMNRQMPGAQADPAWAHNDERPSNYEREAANVPEQHQLVGSLGGQPHTLENVLRTIATNRRER